MVLHDFIEKKKWLRIEYDFFVNIVFSSSILILNCSFINFFFCSCFLFLFKKKKDKSRAVSEDSIYVSCVHFFLALMLDCVSS